MDVIECQCATKKEVTIFPSLDEKYLLLCETSIRKQKQQQSLFHNVHISRYGSFQFFTRRE